MLKRTGIAIALAAILAFGALCPALAGSRDGDALLIDGQVEVSPDLLETPEADGIDIDWQEDNLEYFDVEIPPEIPAPASGASAANPIPARNALGFSGLPVIDTDVTSPSEGCAMLGLRGSYVSNVSGALERINEIRLEACREGVENPDNPGTPLTMDDYVPIKWSSGLEYIARIRAAEASVSMGHVRLTDKSIWGLRSPSGVQSWGEVIAWNWRGDVVTGINQWYEEKDDWINHTPGAVTGHYTQMIEPGHTYVGLGTFCSEDVRYYITNVGEFSSFDGLDETPMDFTGDCVQKLEVKADSIEGGKLLGTQSGVAGDTSELALAAIVADCAFLVPDGVAWSSSAPDITSVDGSGTVTAVTCGVAAITADAPGVVSASADFTVNHVEEALPAVPATCTASGLSVGSRCTVCGMVLQPQQVLPARGHAFGEWVTTQQPTVFSAGTRLRTCGSCGAQESETIPALAPVLKVGKTSASLAKTKSRRVSVAVAAGDAFSARSSDKKVAKVSADADGLTVTAGKVAGTAIITVSTKSGLEANIRVTVAKAKTTKISCKNVTVRKGKKVTLKPKLTPAYSDDPITFKSSNTKIATVNSKGVVKGKNKGSTTIVVKSGKKKIKVKVTVK